MSGLEVPHQEQRQRDERRAVREGVAHPQPAPPVREEHRDDGAHVAVAEALRLPPRRRRRREKRAEVRVDRVGDDADLRERSAAGVRHGAVEHE